MTDSIQKLLGYMQSNRGYSHQNSHRRMRRLGFDAIFTFTQRVTIVLKDGPTLLQDESIFMLVDPEMTALWNFKQGEICAVGNFEKGSGLQGYCRGVEDGLFPSFDPEDLGSLEKDGIIRCLLGGWDKHIKEDRDD